MVDAAIISTYKLKKKKRGSDRFSYNSGLCSLQVKQDPNFLILKARALTPDQEKVHLNSYTGGASSASEPDADPEIMDI